MEIAGAYPPEACVRSLVRELSLDSGAICLRDRVALDTPREVAWVFMLRQKPECREGEVRFGPLAMRYDAHCACAVQEMPVTDERMARNFPGSLWRLTLTSASTGEHELTVTIIKTKAPV